MPRMALADSTAKPHLWLAPRLPILTSFLGLAAIYVPTAMFYINHDADTYYIDGGCGVIRTISDASSRQPEYAVFASSMALTAALLLGSTYVGQAFLAQRCAPALKAGSGKAIVVLFSLLGVASACGVYGIGFVSSASANNRPHFVCAGLFFICAILQCSLLAYAQRAAERAEFITWRLPWRLASYAAIATATLALLAFFALDEEGNCTSFKSILEYVVVTSLLCGQVFLSLPMLSHRLDAEFVGGIPHGTDERWAALHQYEV